MSHPSRRLDDAVHQRTRLGILAVLSESGRVEFTFLRAALELTDGNLSRNLAKLQEAGLVEQSKSADSRGPRTWISITADGRAALRDEVSALQELIQRVDATARAEPQRPGPFGGTAAPQPG